MDIRGKWMPFTAKTFNQVQPFTFGKRLKPLLQTPNTVERQMKPQLDLIQGVENKNDRQR